eukprot:3114111-Prymnesium_polylepis.2
MKATTGRSRKSTCARMMSHASSPTSGSSRWNQSWFWSAFGSRLGLIMGLLTGLFGAAPPSSWTMAAGSWMAAGSAFAKPKPAPSSAPPATPPGSAQGVEAGVMGELRTCRARLPGNIIDVGDAREVDEHIAAVERSSELDESEDRDGRQVWPRPLARHLTRRVLFQRVIPTRRLAQHPGAHLLELDEQVRAVHCRSSIRCGIRRHWPERRRQD